MDRYRQMDANRANAVMAKSRTNRELEKQKRGNREMAKSAKRQKGRKWRK